MFLQSTDNLIRTVCWCPLSKLDDSSSVELYVCTTHHITNSKFEKTEDVVPHGPRGIHCSECSVNVRPRMSVQRTNIAPHNCCFYQLDADPRSGDVGR